MSALSSGELRKTTWRWTDPEGVTHDVAYSATHREHVLLCVGFKPFGYERTATTGCSVTCLACIVLELERYI